MLSNTILAACTFALALASPARMSLNKRAVEVFTDGASDSITPAIATTPLSGITLDDVGGKADAAGAVADVVNKVVQLVQGLIDGDIARRQRFTKETVSAVWTQFGGQGKSVVMSNVGYSLTCTPDVLYSTSYNAKVGSNVSFDVLVFGAGCTFTLKGDGGFENWAYIVQSTCAANRGVLTC